MAKEYSRSNSKEKLNKYSNYLKVDGQHHLLNPLEKHQIIDFVTIDWKSIESVDFVSLVASAGDGTLSPKYEVFAQGSKGLIQISTPDLGYEVWEKIENKAGVDASIYIKVNINDRRYFTAFKFGYNSPTYLSGILKNNFLGLNTFTINNKSCLSFQGQQNHLPTFSANEVLSPINVLNESLDAIQNTAFQLENSNSEDSLFILVKTESGNIFTKSFPNVASFDMSSILKQHVESSTIYFCIGDPNSKDRKVSILNISDDNTLLAVQSDLLKKTVGIDIDLINCPSYSYKNEDIDFVWGDINLAFTKNSSGEYYAKKRIGRSHWDSLVHSKPSLVYGNLLFMDTMSFDFSISSKDLESAHRVLFRDINTGENENSLPQILPDTIESFSRDEKPQVIRLDSITNEHLGLHNISVELEVYDDTPKPKQRKYQFHWGNIDTTLVQDENQGDFTQSIGLSLAKFQSTFKKEPVLTSSKSGVVDSFNCKISHYRMGKFISATKAIVNLKDATVFSNSIKNNEIFKNVKVGDIILLDAFNSPEIENKENLSLEIKLLQNTNADDKLAVGDQNQFLLWGDLKLKSTPLGDSSPKKRIQDQVIDKTKLLEIIHEQSFLNKYGRKEGIVKAEWFVNDNIYNKQKCESEAWRKCFYSRIKESRSGDFISLFMRTKNGTGVMCQFYLDYTSSDAIIGYGDSSFDSLLFKYSKYEFSKSSLPKYNYLFSWGKKEVPLKLVGNPRVYGGEVSIAKKDLIDLLDKPLDIHSSDGEVISVDNAYLILYKLQKEDSPRRFFHYDFDCLSKDCEFNKTEQVDVEEDLTGQVLRARVFIDKHVATEEGIKVSFIDFVVEDDDSAWIPTRWTSKKVNTDLFEFQFVYQNKEKTLIKFDHENEKYTWILEKYKNDTSVELIDMPGFKTTQRAIYTKYHFGNDASIRNVQVLSKNYTNSFRLYEYYDLASKNINLYWKGYPSLYGAQSYCKSDFICAEEGLVLEIDGKELNILRGDLVILPEKGSGSKYVFDDIDCEEIQDALANIGPYTSILFENLIVEDEDQKPLRFPLKFSYHIE